MKSILICGLNLSIGYLLAVLIERRRKHKEKWEKFREWENNRKRYAMEETCPIPIKAVPGESVWVENAYQFGPGSEKNKGSWRQKYVPI